MSKATVEIEVWQQSAGRPDCGLSAVWYAAITIGGVPQCRVMADSRADALASAKRKSREILMRGVTHERHEIPVEELLS